MDIESVREYCLQKAAATEEFPFDDSTLVFKVMGKMFACMPLEKPDMLILKCDADRAIELRERYAAIDAAWHFNKRYWNQHIISALDDGLMMELIDHSYDEVVRKLSRPKREELKALAEELNAITAEL
ncbi:MAG: MmcQ/YjbR family DNA-binding protein [Alistipes sp.]|nr:MmcQ/YjbR family DNA-binding protein [Alistipes sp.]MBR6759752.1 MmcQ/YjbR family DNA-binding protein [Alistipes sp.]